MPDLEHRSVVEFRAERSTIVGYAVVFDTRSRDLGGFVEVVTPAAITAAVRPPQNIVALYNHDPGAVLGRTPKTLALQVDGHGLAFVLDPAPTQAGRDAFELVRRGDISGASFGFKTKKDAWRKDAGVMVRELLDIEIAEISLTAFPCYLETDVSIAQRSLQAAQQHISSRSLTSVNWLRMQGRI